MATSDGFGSPQGSVAATAEGTVKLREAFERAQKNPLRDVGVTAEELQERKRLAAAPYSFASEATSRQFEVKSSTRAQQIVSKGVVDRQVTARQREVLRKMSLFRKLRVGFCAVGAGFAYWMSVTFFLPHYAAVQERNRMLQLRYEMAQRKRAEHMSQPRSFSDENV